MQDTRLWLKKEQMEQKAEFQKQGGESTLENYRNSQWQNRLHITRGDTHTSEDNEENRKEERNIKLELNTRNDKTFKVKQEKNHLLNKTSTVTF